MSFPGIAIRLRIKRPLVNFMRPPLVNQMRSEQMACQIKVKGSEVSIYLKINWLDSGAERRIYFRDEIVKIKGVVFVRSVKKLTEIGKPLFFLLGAGMGKF